MATSLSRRALPPTSVGVGLRPELVGDLLSTPDAAAYLEVLAESAQASGAALREAQAMARSWPVVLHGVKLSLGSAEGVDPSRVARLAEAARQLDARVVSEHISFTRGGPVQGGVEIGHLTALPHVEESLAALQRNVATVVRALPVPLLLENVAWTFRWPGEQLREEDFIRAVVERTGCRLLLDVGNLRANARNEQRDPLAVLDAYPLSAVDMVHVAGSVTEDGFLLDTHAHPVEEETLEVLRHLVCRIGPRPILLERDDNFGDFASLRAELDVLRSINTAPPAHAPLPPATGPHDPAPYGGDLGARQREVARVLTATTVTDAAGLDPVELRRARAILWGKRLDEALPLLPNLAACRSRTRVLQLGNAELAQRTRLPSGTTLADAFAVARACLMDADTRDAAQRDLLALRARFVGPDADGTYRARRGPFVGQARLGAGGRVWMLKGVGRDGALRRVEV